MVRKPHLLLLRADFLFLNMILFLEKSSFKILQGIFGSYVPQQSQFFLLFTKLDSKAHKYSKKVLGVNNEKVNFIQEEQNSVKVLLQWEEGKEVGM